MSFVVKFVANDFSNLRCFRCHAARGPRPAFAPSRNRIPIEAARLNNLGVRLHEPAAFREGVEIVPAGAEADPKLAIARLNDGVAYLNLQKVDEAKAALEDALKQDPKNPNAWYSLGLLAKNTGDAQAAIDAFKHVTEIDPNDADTWYFLGTAYVQAKQFPQAIEAFEHALKINPLHASAEFGLSRAYQQSGDADHAREHLKKFQYITQNKIGAPMSLAYGEQGQYSRAVESPQAVVEGAGADQGAVCGCDEGSGDCVKAEPRHRPHQALVRRSGPAPVFSTLTMMARSIFS